MVYEGIKTYGPIISKLTRTHEKSTLVHSDALFHSVTLPNVRLFEDRARLGVPKPDKTRMLFGNQSGKNSAPPSPRGFCCKSNKIKARTSPDDAVLPHSEEIKQLVGTKETNKHRNVEEE